MTATPATLARWSAAEAKAATGGSGPDGWTAAGLSIDSRSLAPRALFVALKGPSHDGHDHVASAFARGAAAAVVSQRPKSLGPEAPLLLVEDTLAALTALGKAGRARARGGIAAVTGSAGKTGTKEALKAALGDGAFASAASHNNHWGVPLSLANLPPEAPFGVFEIGMNHAGEITPLSRLARPQVAIITNIGLAHIAYLGSQEAIADAKAEIFEGLEPGGTAVLPRDDAFFPRLAEKARARAGTRILTFGKHREADARLLSAELEAEGSRVEAEVEGRRIAYRLALAGAHLVANSLAVMAAASALGVAPETAAERLAALRPLAGRGAQRRLALAGGGEILLIDESYNANPLSVAAALAVLGRARPGPGGRRIAVLGDMLELGRESPRFHAELARAAKEAAVDLLFLCGPEMAHLAAAVPPQRLGAHAPDSAALAPLLTAALRPGDLVLVKGSLGSRMARIVEALTSAAEGRLPRAANGN